MSDKTIRVWGSNYSRMQTVAKEIGGGFLTPNYIIGKLLDHWENCSEREVEKILEEEKKQGWNDEEPDS